ncbi:MAG: alpha/beta fold hydrolase [Clostridia bacterium]|nr:alpha/beta fold hydrolase [Clostridia bacterium]
MKLKKLLCSVLALCLIICGCAIPASVSAEEAHSHEWSSECKTDCNGECGTSPVIIVHGIMQSQVYVQDKDGNDIMTSDGFPIVEGMDMAFMFDTVALGNEFKASIGDILLSVATGNRDKLFDIVLGILDESFSSHYFNPDGTRTNGVSVDEYWYSLEECMQTPDRSYGYAKGYGKDENGNTLPTTKYETEFDFIKRQVDITGYCEEYGYDHAYYYAYSSFGDTLEAAANLNEYIDMVKAQTGHDKVSLVFISLGGTIGNVYLAEHCDPTEVDRVVFAAAAVDGSYLLGDLMAGKSTLGDGNTLYNDLIPNLISILAEEYEALAYLGNAVARAIPQELFSDFLNEALTRAVNEVLGKLMHNCPSMWALVPSAMYPELSKELISDDAHKLLKEKTDKYYEIQKNAAKTVQEMTEKGVDIFVICGYDLELLGLVEHYKLSSDNIIQAESTSIGATFANCGETLAEDYKPAIDETYISPDGILDAGTCALPERTWFIKGQSHLKLQSRINDVIELCIQLISNYEITDARENNGGYPQFLEYRNLSKIESMMNKFNEADLSALSPEQVEALNAAYAKAEELLADRAWDAEKALEVEKELYSAMFEAGLLSDSDNAPFVKYTLMPILTKIAKAFSDVFKMIFGGSDYWKFFANILKQIVEAI